MAPAALSSWARWPIWSRSLWRFWPELLGPAPEPSKPHELVGESREGGVAPARIGHDEDGGARDPLRLEARPRAGRGPDELAVGRPPHERHDARPDTGDRARQAHAAARVVARR